jgi:hypothetical protein
MVWCWRREEARAFRSRPEDLPVGSTLGLSYRDGRYGLITNTGTEYVTEVGP